MEGGGGKEPTHRKEPDKDALPDLALMQAMSLMEPGLCRVQSNQDTKQEQLDFSFCLIMKVACTGGVPRTISQQALEQAMTRAWRDKFYAISQIPSKT